MVENMTRLKWDAMEDNKLVHATKRLDFATILIERTFQALSISFMSEFPLLLEMNVRCTLVDF